MEGREKELEKSDQKIQTSNYKDVVALFNCLQSV